MKLLIKQSFTQRNSSTGALWSPRKGEIVETTTTVGNALIADGFAEEYTLVTPTGKVTITENGTVNVAEYEKAQVNVPNPSNGTLEVTAEGTYDCTDYASVHVAIAEG